MELAYESLMPVTHINVPKSISLAFRLNVMPEGAFNAVFDEWSRQHGKDVLEEEQSVRLRAEAIQAALAERMARPAKSGN